MGSGRNVTFEFGDVVIGGAVRSTIHRGLDGFARWPCPGCGAERLLDDSWLVTVSDADGANVREVLLCAGCAAAAGIPESYG